MLRVGEAIALGDTCNPGVSWCGLVIALPLSHIEFVILRGDDDGSDLPLT